MTTTATIERIKKVLAEIETTDFQQSTIDLLKCLGYESDRTLETSGIFNEFIREFPSPNPGTITETLLREHAESVNVIFQFTDSEVVSAAASQGLLMDDEASFDSENAASFIFVAIKLNGDEYTRGMYAEFTREINKRLSNPTVVIFKTSANLVTLAFVHRRRNKRDNNRDVLGNVSLIRQIEALDPHRAHLDILRELSLSNMIDWMRDNGKPYVFDSLLAAWLSKLDTQELNKRFYGELFTWFERAVDQAKFPTNSAKPINPKEHVVRLITRMLFIWFIKEKHVTDVRRLVADDLFNEQVISRLLKEYDPHEGDSYYRAVLQNLFFATLNTEINRRGFSNVNPSTHRDFSRYRYKNEMSNPTHLVELFNQTPFINGGLFDCLDSEEATSDGGYRIDCFSDNPRHKSLLSIPNRLLFDYNDGIIELFKRYKFTIEENTPAEREVALDPELLGSVFENLLAAIVPETQESARKQTGSYYTPRRVVDYMIDEVLVESLAISVQPTDGNAMSWSDSLRCLLDFEDAFEDAKELFDESESEGLVRAISEIKVLDPAVGSGAFPMGILHKLTLALRRLDPENRQWEELQKEMAARRAAEAFNTPNQQEREAELKEISDTFERYRDSDFGRKLYLIQNSVFGVDIQPIACQIAKLRFFISLAIEQEPNNDSKDNYGIKPLPNLETRFVAANTLLGLDKPEQLSLGQTAAVEQLHKQLADNRERHFHAKSREAKLKCVEVDERLRQKLATGLENVGMPAGAASKIAYWKPYDQNEKANWFDPEYMFGVAGGFDVVIGNPPYVRSEGYGQNPETRRQIAESNIYETLHEKWDLYIPFIERGYKLLKPNGFTTMIVSDAYCHARYARRSREWFLNKSRVVRLDFFGKIQIFDAGVRNIIYLFQNTDGHSNKPERRVHHPEFGTIELLSTDDQTNLTERAFFPEDATSREFTTATVPLRNICYVTYGLRPSSKSGAQEKFVTADLTTLSRDAIHRKPFVEGKHLDRWLPATKLWLEWGTTRAPSQFYAPTFDELYEVNEKLLVQRSPGPDPKACYDDQHLIFTPSSVGFILWHDLSGVRNRSIQKQARYADEMRRNVVVMQREEVEKISRGFDIKFLLGVLNSAVARQSLLSNRRSNVHLYPDDWKQLQIPCVPRETQETIIRLVDRILIAKSCDPDADISYVETEIDELVFQLYGMKDEEIAAVKQQQ